MCKQKYTSPMRAMIFGMVLSLFLPNQIWAAPGDMITIAGGGSSSTDNMPATDFTLDEPHDVAIDADGNVYIADRDLHKVFKVDKLTGTITVVAGDGRDNFLGDGGPATDASMWEPHRVAFDSVGNLYIADSRNGFIRKVDSNGVITSVAGADFFAATSSFDSGIPATDRILFLIRGMHVDAAGNIYVNEGFVVSKVDAQTGIISAVAGNGNDGFSGDGGPAIDARLDFPEDIFVRGDSLYIADRESHRIRVVDLQTGIINTIVGNGREGFDGDGGPALEAELNSPYDVYVDEARNLFIADQGNDRIRRVDGQTGIITTVAGSGSSSFDGDGPALNQSLDSPRSITADALGNLYTADLRHSRIRIVLGDQGENPIGTTLATGVQPPEGGTGTQTGGDSGTGTGTGTGGDTGTGTGTGTGNTGTDGGTQTGGGTTTPTAPPADVGAGFGTGADGDMVTVAGGGSSSSDNVLATDFTLDEPHDVEIDSEGNMYIADRDLHRVYKVDQATGTITIVAGDGSTNFTGDGGPAVDAGMWEPHRVGFDGAGNLYIADSRNGFIRKVDSNGVITSVAGADFFAANSSFDSGIPALDRILFLIRGMHVDAAGNIYVNEAFMISKIDAQTGIITTVAGNGNDGFGGDGGPATDARLDFPEDIFVRGDSLYIADRESHRIRVVDLQTGIINTIVGNGREGFDGDGGPALEAELNSPYDVYVDEARNLFIADQGNDRIRRVDGQTGIITTVAGSGSSSFDGDGPALEKSLDSPRSVTLDAAGDLYIADLSHSRIRKVIGAGSPMAGGGTTDPGGQTGGSTVPTITLGGDATEGTLATLGEKLYYQFTLDSDQTVEIVLDPLFDARLQLFVGSTAADAIEDNNIDNVDNSFGTEGTQLFLAAGTYLIEVSEFQDLGTGDFTLELDPLQINTIGLGETKSGRQVYYPETHFYQFALEAETNVQFDLTSVESDAYLLVTEGSDIFSEVIVAEDDDGGEGLNSRIQQTLAAGTYMIQVFTIPSGDYSLQVSTATGEVVDSGSKTPQTGDGSWVIDLNSSTGDQSARDKGGIKAGDQIVIEVLHNTSVTSSRGAELTLRFEPSKLQPVTNSVTVPTGFLMLGATVQNNNQYQVTVGALTPQAFDQNSVALLTFQVADGFDGETDIKLIRASIADDSGQQHMTTPNTSIVLRSGGSAGPCPDVDGNGVVDFPDFLVFSGAFGSSSGDASYNASVDLDSNGSVDFSDFLVFSGQFGQAVSCKPAFHSKPILPEVGINTTAGVVLNTQTSDQAEMVDVVIGLHDAVSVSGFNFQLSYDPSVLDLVSSEGIEPSMLSGNLTSSEIPLQYKAQPGKVILADYLQPGSFLQGDAEVVRLTFRVLDGQVPSRIDLADALISDGAGHINALHTASLRDARPRPTELLLAQNHPNPFNPETQIAYQIAESGDVFLAIYNVLGQHVRTLVQSQQPSGHYHVAWNGKDDLGAQVSSGVYFYRLRSGNQVLSRRMMLLK